MSFSPAELSVFDALLASVAEEMGVVLGKTGYSPNIRERRDYSCAVFDRDGNLVAQAAHIPVHLGAMPEAVRSVQSLAPWRPGDLAMLNDPFRGGTHLPDISVIAPVFSGRTLLGLVASRAHHADIGGISPGSMPLSSELLQEGLVIPPVRLRAAGQLNRGLIDLLLANTRTPAERAGDLSAQIGAVEAGTRRLQALAERYGASQVRAAMRELRRYTARLAGATLRRLADGAYAAEDVLEDDGFGSGPLPIKLQLTLRRGQMHFDFSGTAPQAHGPVNAVAAVTKSACYYCVRCLLPEHTPHNDGAFDRIAFELPEASLVNARWPAAVSAGNVETSQRITDVVLQALAQALPDEVPACSAGTMNNLTFGGVDADGRQFAYYETIGGGAGGGPSGPGLSCVQTHMTNTLNTPVEALELAFPMTVRRYEVIAGSGGHGRHAGGDGIRREIEFHCDADVTIVSERRLTAPPGADGGGPGRRGVNAVLRADGTRQALPGKATARLQAGDRLIVETPGGGGWGSRGERSADSG
jgi:N-methylhydantoinase B